LIRRWEEDNGRLLLLLDDSNDDSDDGEDCRRPLAMVVLIIVRMIMVMVNVVCCCLRWRGDGRAKMKVRCARYYVYGRFFTYTIMSNFDVIANEGREFISA
jgi:hypothetical protein